MRQGISGGESPASATGGKEGLWHDPPVHPRCGIHSGPDQPFAASRRQSPTSYSTDAVAPSSLTQVATCRPGSGSRDMRLTPGGVRSSGRPSTNHQSGPSGGAPETSKTIFCFGAALTRAKTAPSSGFMNCNRAMSAPAPRGEAHAPHGVAKERPFR